jgi:putative transposase
MGFHSNERSMSRPPRLDIANVPRHVIQRGNDRQPCFFREIDCIRCLQNLREAALECGCQIRACVLMTHRVHLLVTLRETSAVSRLMQSVGRRHVRFISDALARTGTLWEGRYKSSLIDSEHYLLACYRYIELNPVRAALASAPADYCWLNHACNAQGSIGLLITPHPVYQGIHPDAESRRACYRSLVAQGINDDELAMIRTYAQRQRAFGTNKFQQAIEFQPRRRGGIGAPGRAQKAGGSGVERKKVSHPCFAQFCKACIVMHISALEIPNDGNATRSSAFGDRVHSSTGACTERNHDDRHVFGSTGLLRDDGEQFRNLEFHRAGLRRRGSQGALYAGHRATGWFSQQDLDWLCAFVCRGSEAR